MNINYKKNNSKVLSNKQTDNYLTPIPMNPKKSIIKNNYDKKALNNAQKTAVFLRRVEYSTNMRKNNQSKKIYSENLRKIIIIQKWWKTLYLIILLQKNIRGFLSRTKLIESLEKQESFINMLLHIHYLHKKIVFRRFLRKLFYKKNILLTMLNNFLISNLRLILRKWKFNCEKIKRKSELKIWFEDWKKTIDKFSIVKSILKNKEIKHKKYNKKNNSNNNQNLKKLNSKNKKNEKKENNKNTEEKKKMDEKEKKSKKTLVLCFKKKHQIHNETEEGDNNEENNFINENYEMMLFKNKKNSIRNLMNNPLKKFEDLKKNNLNKTKILSSRRNANELLNKNEFNKTFTNEKFDKYCKSDIRNKATKQRISKKCEDKDKKNKIKTKNVKKNSNEKIINDLNINDINYNSCDDKKYNKDNNDNKKMNIDNNKEDENNEQSKKTPIKENIISNENLTNIIEISPDSNDKIKDENLLNDNYNDNFIIDQPFQDILKENTQASIKEKDIVLNIDFLSDNKDDDILNKDLQLDQDKIMTIDENNVNEENIEEIIENKNDNDINENKDCFICNNKNIDNINNNEEKKIKEMIISFDKKKNDKNENKEINNPEKSNLNDNQKNENLNNNNNEIMSDKEDNILENKKQEKSFTEEKPLNQDNKEIKEEKEKKEIMIKKEKPDKTGSSTLVKKNNILQAKIQFQKPTQNILELKQKNNQINQQSNDNINDEKNKNNKNEKDDDLDTLNINEEIENVSKFKPPSKIKEIIIENLNLNKHIDKRNDDFYTGYDNFVYEDEERRLNHSLSNLELGQDYYINNLNQTQNYIYTPINDRFIKFSPNQNNEVLGYPLPINFNQNNYYGINNNNINNYNKVNDIDNNLNMNYAHKKTYSSNNLIQYKHPHLSGMTFTKKIIPKADVSFTCSNTNFKDNQNININSNSINSGVNISPNQNNFGNKIYMRRINICPPKNLNKTYIQQQQSVNTSNIN